MHFIIFYTQLRDLILSVALSEYFKDMLASSTSCHNFNI